MANSGDLSERDAAAAALAKALDEARWARRRLAERTLVTGFHGENFERRWQRVGRIVTEANDRAVHEARGRARQAGWSEAELEAAGLGGDHPASPSA